MKRILIAMAAVALLGGAASAAPPTDGQLAEFYKTCMGIAQNETLCACKRDAAPKLLDEKFMAVVLTSMKGKAPPKEYDVPYNDYIARSNAICIPGY
jgi:hypothetical protein